MKRFIFNPEHDLCLADGSGSFIPPASVVEFAGRCSWVERFMVAPQGAAQSTIGGEGAVEIVPWGWNRCLRDRLLKEGVSAELLPDDAELDFIRVNSRRELAVELLERLHERVCSERKPCSIISPAYRIVARTMEDIEKFLQSSRRVVLKAPLSGSGKGVRFVSGELMKTDRGWCKRTLLRQGAVIVERRMDVVQEFAMLFECGEKVSFRGYSLFYAANGAYKGNLLASNEHMEKALERFIPLEELRGVQLGLCEFLQEKLQGRYKGFVGVDQFVAETVGRAAVGIDAVGMDSGGMGTVEVAGEKVPGDKLSGRKYCWNPAVEINLRMTMGLIARNIYDFHAAEYGLGEGTHCFEPERGIFKCG